MSDPTKNRSWLDESPPSMWTRKLQSLEDMQQLMASHGPLFSRRRNIENSLARALPADSKGCLPALCSVCDTETILEYDHLYAATGQVNWRERLICARCGLNNRLRLSMTMLNRFTTNMQGKEPRIYATEHLTPLGEVLCQRYDNIRLSEYFGPKVAKGSITEKGVMNQDVTDLTFPDCSYDIVLSFDVLEHVPDYHAALREFHRVLDHNGTLLLSVPFVTSSLQSIVRARLNADGEIEHLLEPEYHGDPVNPEGGVLCFYHYGWSLLEDLREAGFADAFVSLNWSLGYGHIGSEQVMIVATRS